MEILRDISLFWSMAHVTVIFLMLFRSRYAQKKTIILSMLALGTLMVINAVGLVGLGVAKMGQLILFTCSIPSFLFFWFITRDAGSCYLFTFCLADTVCLWILGVTNLLDHFLGGGQFVLMFILRLIAFPALEYVIWRWLRSYYQNLKRMVRRGWAAYAGMTVLYYLLLLVMFEYPTQLNSRPEYIPAYVMVLVLMVFNYVIIFLALYRQCQLYEREMAEQELQKQKMSLKSQLENQQHIRQLRHDMRGHVITLQGLVTAGRSREAEAYLEEMGEAIDAAQVMICPDPYLNAQLTYYTRRFRDLDVELKTDIRVGPESLPYTEVCSILSNGLENAWRASAEIAPEERSASVSMKYSRDYLVIRIRNNCREDLHVERGLIPPTTKEGKDHGLGLLSIHQAARKLDGDMFCYTENGCFVLDVMLQVAAGQK